MIPTRCNQFVSGLRIIGFEKGKWIVAYPPRFIDNQDISTAYSILAAFESVMKEKDSTSRIPTMQHVSKYKTQFGSLVHLHSKHHNSDRNWVYAYDPSNELVQRIVVLNYKKPSFYKRCVTWVLSLINVDANRTFQKLNESRGGSCFIISHIPVVIPK